MNWDINVVAGLVAGLAAMVPGSVIYAPPVLGKLWMKEIGMTEKQMKTNNPGKSMAMMLFTSLINGLVVSVLVFSAGADTILEAVDISLLAMGWFLVSGSLMQVFFERRSWTLFKINALNHIITAVVIGVVVGLFL